MSLTRSKRILACALACALSTSPLTAVAAPAAGGARAAAEEEMLVEDASPAGSKARPQAPAQTQQQTPAQQQAPAQQQTPAQTPAQLQAPAQADAPGQAEGSLGEEAAPGADAKAPAAEAGTADAKAPAADEAGTAGAKAPAAGEGSGAAAELAEEGAAQEGAAIVAQADARPVLHARAHVQDKGWMPEQSGARVVVGTTGQALRVEALRLWVTGAAGAVEGKAHVQNIGWRDWARSSAEQELGTTGQALRVEALRLRLTPELASAGWHIYYRLHVQDFDWLGWAKDGELAGSAGYAKRAECVELRLVGPGEQPPAAAGSPYRDRGYVGAAHVQNVGWQDERSGYSFSLGTTGRGLRVEAITIARPSDDRSGDVVYEAHVQNVGWQGERRNGQAAGTSGQALRVEAFRVRLTGDLERDYDVWYRVHAQDFGWMGWTKNGEKAGSQGAAKRLESIQVAFVAKGAPAPAADGQATASPFVDLSTAQVSYRSTLRSGAQGFVGGGQVSGTTGKSQPVTAVAAKLSGVDGFITYSAHVSGKGWVPDAHDGADCGGGTVEALRFSLSGEVSKYFDVWYRAHVSQVGWLDWACNGGVAGTTGMGLPVEAYQLVLRPKGTGAPGATAFASFRGVTGDRELDLILLNLVRNVTGTGPDALRRGYNYVRDNFTTRDQNKFGKGVFPSWETAYAKEFYRNRSGNCYRWASFMSVLARALGYNTRTIAGSVLLHFGEGAHSWTEVYMNGGTYILDANMEHSFGRNFYLVTYANSPAVYYK